VTPLPLPPLAAVLLRSRRDALGSFLALGWRPWAHPIGLDAERRRALNVDLSEPEVSLGDGDAVRAVANVETDREGQVTHLELVASDPAEPVRVAAALLGGDPGAPRTGGGAAAREWVWGPESGATASVGGEPVRLWICAEQAYGDRLWLMASVVRRARDDD
jgi:hypothetical protein